MLYCESNDINQSPEFTTTATVPDDEMVGQASTDSQATMNGHCDTEVNDINEAIEDRPESPSLISNGSADLGNVSATESPPRPDSPSLMEGPSFPSLLRKYYIVMNIII